MKLSIYKANSLVLRFSLFPEILWSCYDSLSNSLIKE